MLNKQNLEPIPSGHLRNYSFYHFYFGFLSQLWVHCLPVMVVKEKQVYRQQQLSFGFGIPPQDFQCLHLVTPMKTFRWRHWLSPNLDVVLLAGTEAGLIKSLIANKFCSFGHIKAHRYFR